MVESGYMCNKFRIDYNIHFPLRDFWDDLGELRITLNGHKLTGTKSCDYINDIQIFSFFRHLLIIFQLGNDWEIYKIPLSYYYTSLILGINNVSEKEIDIAFYGVEDDNSIKNESFVISKTIFWKEVLRVVGNFIVEAGWQVKNKKMADDIIEFVNWYENPSKGKTITKKKEVPRKIIYGDRLHFHYKIGHGDSNLLSLTSGDINIKINSFSITEIQGLKKFPFVFTETLNSVWFYPFYYQILETMNKISSGKINNNDFECDTEYGAVLMVKNISNKKIAIAYCHYIGSTWVDENIFCAKGNYYAIDKSVFIKEMCRVIGIFINECNWRNIEKIWKQHKGRIDPKPYIQFVQLYDKVNALYNC